MGARAKKITLDIEEMERARRAAGAIGISLLATCRHLAMWHLAHGGKEDGDTVWLVDSPAAELAKPYTVEKFAIELGTLDIPGTAAGLDALWRAGQLLKREDGAYGVRGYRSQAAQAKQRQRAAQRAREDAARAAREAQKELLPDSAIAAAPLSFLRLRDTGTEFEIETGLEADGEAVVFERPSLVPSETPSPNVADHVQDMGATSRDVVLDIVADNGATKAADVADKSLPLIRATTATSEEALPPDRSLEPLGDADLWKLTQNLCGLFDRRMEHWQREGLIERSNATPSLADGLRRLIAEDGRRRTLDYWDALFLKASRDRWWVDSQVSLAKVIHRRGTLLKLETDDDAQERAERMRKARAPSSPPVPAPKYRPLGHADNCACVACRAWKAAQRTGAAP